MDKGTYKSKWIILGQQIFQFKTCSYITPRMFDSFIFKVDGKFVDCHSFKFYRMSIVQRI